MNYILHGLIFCLLRLVFVESEFKEVRKGAYKKNGEELKRKDFLESNINNSVLIEHSRELYQEEEKRKEQLFSKSETLLTICGLILPIIAYLTTLKLNVYLLIISILLILVTFILNIQIQRISTFRKPVIDKALLSKEKKSDQLIKAIAFDYYSSSFNNSFVIDYLADLLRASYRYLVISIIYIFSLYIFATFSLSETYSETLDKVIEVEKIERNEVNPAGIYPDSVKPIEEKLLKPNLEAKEQVDSSSFSMPE